MARETICLSLPIETAKALRKEAERLGISMSALVQIKLVNGGLLHVVQSTNKASD